MLHWEHEASCACTIYCNIHTAKNITIYEYKLIAKHKHLPVRSRIFQLSSTLFFLIKNDIFLYYFFRISPINVSFMFSFKVLSCFQCCLERMFL